MRVHKRIQLWVSMMIAYVSVTNGQGISCFKCTVVPLPGAREESSQICSHFEENKHFQVYCPKSTLCMKRTIHHKLGNGTIVQTSVERDCAPQLDVYQAYDFKDRVWRSKEKIVQTAYRPGCSTGEDRGSPGGPSEYCFCSDHLCNRSQALNGHFFILGALIPTIIVIMQGLLIS